MTGGGMSGRQIGLSPAMSGGCVCVCVCVSVCVCVCVSGGDQA